MLGKEESRFHIVGIGMGPYNQVCEGPARCYGCRACEASLPISLP